MRKNKLMIIVGGGASGFFSAIQLKERFRAAEVVVIEKGKSVLSKVRISGGGRCNVTHACFDSDRLCTYYPRGAKELKGAFHRFQPKDTMDWFEARGVSLKIEEDGRVFPVSNNSETIITCLTKEAERLGVKVWTQCKVESVKKEEGHFAVKVTGGKTHHADKLILATGGAKDGHRIAMDLGHTIITPVPSLFTFNIPDKRLHEQQGIAVKRAAVKLKGLPKKTSRVEVGAVLITHWGLSGPGVIVLSSWYARQLHEAGYKAIVELNWLADREESGIRDCLEGAQEQNKKKQVKQESPFKELSKRLWVYLLEKAGIEPDRAWQDLSKKSVNRLVETLRRTTYHMNGKSMYKEEFVTCGGVSLKEINFKTMESKVCRGLYVIGEALDCDGVTGGFNFQNAWTTGFLVE